MKIFDRSYRALLILSLFLLGTTRAFSSDINFHQRMRDTLSTTVINGSNVTVQATPVTGSFIDTRVKDVVTFGVDHNYSGFLPAYTSTVSIRVDVYNTSSIIINTYFKDLSIAYNPYTGAATFKDKAMFTFANAYKYKVTVLHINVNGILVSVLPKNLFIDSDIGIERYYNFASVANTLPSINAYVAQNIDCDVSNIPDQLQVSWNGCVGPICPEEYQVEWTFINDYGTSYSTYILPPYLHFDFRHNSTRITTVNSFYNISLIFDHGYVLYRIRGIGRDITNPQNYIYGSWSLPDTGAVGSMPAVSVYPVTNPHEFNKNWQYSGTFAEEGKKKEVLSYFDGSLRNRQTVTKMNSDLNTLVGETIYDYQGRPAVNVLPSVVPFPACSTSYQQPAIKFYDNFNQDDSTHAFLRDDFDADQPTATCSITVSPMGTNSGASNYYSSANSNKNAQQAFLPDAKKFPYTQVEYTNDNTGRINRQGGVGIDHQLNTGHETQYFYGKPNQVNLDRLFGSEVGDALHYKENAVVDANGQTSLTYIDQEGRTVATSLSGDSLQNMNGIYENNPNALRPLIVDLFNKDANGNSLLNIPSNGNDAIEFYSELLVPYNSVYTFSYSLKVDTLFDACLRPNICFNCIYNLEMHIYDDCGTDLIVAANGGHPIEKKVGYFSVVGADTVFNTTCSGPTTDNESFSMLMKAGNYSMSKILRVDPNARNFYIQQYLDSANNSCVKTLHQFVSSALAGLDTSDCYVNCTTCAKKLGDRDDFISSGRGTGQDYDFLLDQCLAPCKPHTLCDASYGQMLSDMSPGGQYGQYLDNLNHTNPSAFPLSVFNTGNDLPAHLTSSSSGTWRFPKTTLNSNTYFHYLDNQGKNSRINLIPIGTWNSSTPPSSFNPAVLVNTPSTVFYDNSNSVWYTYPENLLNFSDFVANWNPSWATALVQYHPEYCYYEKCVHFGDKTSSQPLSSDEYDELLKNTTTFAGAIAAGFIKVNPGSIPPSPSYQIRLNDPTFVNSTYPYDVFFVNYPSESLALKNQLTNYQTINSQVLAMSEVAAYTVRCGNLFGNSTNVGCINFADPAGAINDQEWNTYKFLYLSSKQTIQYKIENTFAQSCGGYNACMGDSSGTYSPTVSGASQPCAAGTYTLYINKQKRFPSPGNSIPIQNSQQAAAAVYSQGGQCPVELALQNLLTEMAAKNKLLSDVNDPLSNFSQFTYPLYNDLNGNVTPSSPISYAWTSSTTGLQTSAQIINTNLNITACNLTLDFSHAGITNPSNYNITFLGGMSDTVITGLTNAFRIYAVFTPISTGPAIHGKVIGSSCFDLTGCNFMTQCQPNDFANELAKLMSQLATNSQLQTINLNLNTATYSPFVTTVIKNTLGASSVSNVVWNYNSPNYEILDAGNPGTKLVIKFNSVMPTSLSIPSIKKFTGINSNFFNFFVVNAQDASGNGLGTINGEVQKITSSSPNPVGISMGDCGPATPATCLSTPYKLRKDLEILLYDVLNGYSGGSIDLTASSGFSNLISSNLPFGLTSTSSTLYHGTQGTLSDSLAFTILTSSDTCKMYLKARPTNSFNNIIDVMSLVGTGDANSNGNYNNFYMIVKYNVGGNNVLDTIKGYSCLGINNCYPCPDSSGVAGQSAGSSIGARMAASQFPVPVMASNGMTKSDSTLVAQGLATQNMTLIAYKTYATAITTLDTRMVWLPTDTAYVTPISHLSFASNGDSLTLTNYLRFIANYDTAIDNKAYLRDISLFIADYGNYLNAYEEYQRYTRSVSSYNARVIQTASSSPIMAAISDTLFHANMLADSAYVYSNYLKAYPQTSQTPVPVLNYFAGRGFSTVLATPNTDSCQNHYQNYVAAWKFFSSWNSTHTTPGAPPPCPNFSNFNPLLGYNDFHRLFCCDSTAGGNYKNYYAYLATLYDTTNCPSIQAFERGCLTQTQLATCDKDWSLLKQVISKYNTSPFVQTNPTYTLNPNPFPSFDVFVLYGYCSCVEDYISYLTAYTYLPASANEPPAVSISNFNECPAGGQGGLDPGDTCKAAYSNYLSVLGAYNVSAYSKGHNFTLSTTLFPNYFGFALEGFCKCLSSYIQYLMPYLSAPANSTMQLPVNITMFPGCTGPPAADTCKIGYQDYVNLVNNYNSSAYATAHGNTISTSLFTSYMDFQTQGYCDCVNKYLIYLQQYVSAPANSNLALPDDIRHYTGCNLFNPPPDTCSVLYQSYQQAVSNYNNYALSQGQNNLTVNVIYTQHTFDSLDYCLCTNHYIAYLNTIVSGTTPFSQVNQSTLDLANICKLDTFPKCKPNITGDTITLPAPPSSQNPCVKYKQQLAAMNATNAYNQYVDSLTTFISAAYNNHCLGAFENYTTSYQDKEYHFTLYYYDQAGNLIKTVPPEGVHQVSISGPSTHPLSPLNAADSILNDRTFNRHVFMTNHTLATTYLYNSLNQLVRQSLPDHDKMDVWNLTLPNGLNSQVNITSTQFLSPSAAYLTGYIEATGTTPRRGMLYFSGDGGKNWTQVDNFAATFLKKVKMTNVGNTGFAIGDNGIILRTDDAGATWDIVPVYLKANFNTSGIPNWTDLSIIGNNLVVVGSNGNSLRYNIGSGVITILTGTGLNDNFTASTNDNTNFYATSVDNTGASNIWQLTGTTWASIANPVPGEDYNDVSFVSTTPNIGFIGGTGGSLQKTIDNGLHWLPVVTDVSNDFQKIYFRNDSVGISIIDSVPGYPQVWKTANGGKNWTLASKPGDYYNNMSFYYTTVSSVVKEKGYAVGRHGLVKRIAANETTVPPYFGNPPYFGFVDLNSPTVITNTLTAVDVSPFNLGSGLYFNSKVITLDALGHAYYATNGDSSFINWSPQVTVSGVALTKVAILLEGSTQDVRAMILDKNGKIFGFVKPASGVVSILTPPSLPPTFFFSEVKARGNTFYALDTMSKQFYQFYYNGTTFLHNVIANSPGTNPLAFAKSIAFASDSVPSNTYYRIVEVGKNAIIGQGRFSVLSSTPYTPGNCRWEAPKPFIPALNDIKIYQFNNTAGSSTLFAIGKNGYMVRKNIASGPWRKVTPNIKIRNIVRDIGFTNHITAGTFGAMVGDSSKIYQLTINTSDAITFSNVAVPNAPSGNILNDVAVDAVSTYSVYVVGQNGSAYLITNITATVPVVTQLSYPQASGNLFGVTIKPTDGTALVVGDGNSIYNFGGTTFMTRINSIYTPGLKDVHYNNISNGYVVGDFGTIRHTSDGVNWNIIKPDISAVNTPTINAVWTYAPDQALFAGNAKYIAKSAGNITPVIVPATITGSPNLNDIEFGPNSNNTMGYIVGDNHTALNVTAPSIAISQIANTITPGTNFNALHVFLDNTFIVVGNLRSVYYFNGATFKSQLPSSASPTSVFNDVFFHDDRVGYIVGNNGLVFKCNLTQNIQRQNSLLPANSINWGTPRPTGTSGTINISTLGFVDRYNGFLGGDFPGSSTLYAEDLHDESNLFSTFFYYDRLGRMIVSQNTRQYGTGNRIQDSAKYSYTRYDALGRIVEVGEKKDDNNGAGALQFSDIFGTTVSSIFFNTTIDDANYNTWLYPATANNHNNQTRRQVTHTFYDITVITGLPITQNNLRKRVASSTIEDIDDNNPQTFNHGTHYSYDIHGNVNTLLQQNNDMPVTSEVFKETDYTYDLISGKVNMVIYQRRQADQFYHMYEYDADNRITNEYTSNDSTIWDQDAKYLYYAHGPLARTEIGNNKIQGVDHAYTIQGWIKGINSNNLNINNDIGADGNPTSVNQNFAYDAYGYTLGYYNGDYQPIGTNWISNPATRFEAITTASSLNLNRFDLFNGNIGQMVTTITDPTTRNVLPNGNAYHYDQLNRLVESRSFNNLNLTTNAWGVAVYNGMYNNIFNYDANGNITRQKRKDQNGQVFDDLRYKYFTQTGFKLQNRLYNVKDSSAADPTVTDDIKDMVPFNNNPTQVNFVNNYRYDAIGNLTHDSQEGIDSIQWNVYGKIDKVTRVPGFFKLVGTTPVYPPNLEFEYDAAGNRIAKIVKPNNVFGPLPAAQWVITYYVRDAQGNILAVYKQTGTHHSLSVQLNEQHIYGSSRVGIRNTSLEMIGAILPSSLDTSGHYLAIKRFELDNHLGNVITVVSDKKIPVQSTSNPTLIDHYISDIVSATDYYPFGSVMYARNFNASSYRMGFNSKEKDDEIEGAGDEYDYGARIYEARLGRFLSVDPLAIKFAFYSTYQFAGNKPIWATDLDGAEEKPTNAGTTPPKSDQAKAGASAPPPAAATSGTSTSNTGTTGTSSTGTSTSGSSNSNTTATATEATGKTTSQTKAPAFTLVYGNTPGNLENPPFLQQTYGSEGVKYYNTHYENASGKFAIDEPNTFVQAEVRLKGSNELVFLGMKQKFKGPYEAPTAAEVGYGLKKDLFSSKGFELSVDLTATTGPTVGSIRPNPAVGTPKGYSFGFPGQDQYRVIGWGGTAIARVDAVFAHTAIVFAAVNLHHYQGFWVNGTSGAEKISYLGSAEITIGIGFKIGPKRK